MTTLTKLIKPLAGLLLASIFQLSLANSSLAKTLTLDNDSEDMAESLAQTSAEDVASETDRDEDSSDTLRIVVTATRTEENIVDVPRTVRVIEREEIQQQLELSNNLNNVLGQLLPGFSPPPLRSGNRGFTLRGRGLQVLIDGVPQNANGFVFGELNAISADSLERIEVVPGANALYGDGATGGTINLITRAPVEEGIVYSADVGTSAVLTNLSDDGTFSYTGGFGVAAAEEDGDARISINYEANNASFDSDGNRIIPVAGLNEFDRLGVLAKLGYNIDDNQRIGLTYSFYRDSVDTEFTTDSSSVAAPGTQTATPLFLGDFNYEQDPERINHLINLTYRHADVFGSQLDAQIFFNDLEFADAFADLRPTASPFFPEVTQGFFELTEIGTRVQVDTPLGNSANVLWGADYSEQDNESISTFVDPVAFDANRDINIIEEFPSTYELKELGLFAQARWDVSDQFQISGGLRYDDISFSADDFRSAFIFALPREREGGSGSFDDVSFNAGLLYRPSPEVGLFANFSQGFSVPNILFALDAGPTFSPDSLELEPISVDNYEIGARAEFDTIQASIAGFYSESDLGAFFQFDPNSGFTELERAPQRNYGVEVAVDWQPSDTWRLGGNFTWSEGDSDPDDDGDFDPLTSLSVSPLKLGLYVENETTPRWTNRLQLLFVGDRDRAFDKGIDLYEVESYFSLDLISSLQMGPGRLTLGIENLLNSDELVLNSQERVGFFEDRRFARPGITASLRYSIEF
ncbi:MAG: TonB-dependent receptor [Cyanobacteria bacterium P01_D01_bin.56]